MLTKKIQTTVTTIVLILLCTIGCSESKTPETRTKEEANINSDSLIKRGNYLVTFIGCNDCHSPKKMGPFGPEVDSALMLSGNPSSIPLPKIQGKSLNDWVLFSQDLTAAAGPWGISFSANLTPDETGIGGWTETQFLTAMRKGKYKGMENGRSLLPPMPWQSFQHASDDDLNAIFAYLKSIPPVKNIVRSPISPDDLKKMAE